jgi:hypothetical protein
MKLWILASIGVTVLFAVGVSCSWLWGGGGSGTPAQVRDVGECAGKECGCGPCLAGRPAECLCRAGTCGALKEGACGCTRCRSLSGTEGSRAPCTCPR